MPYQISEQSLILLGKTFPTLHLPSTFKRIQITLPETASLSV